MVISLPCLMVSICLSVYASTEDGRHKTIVAVMVGVLTAGMLVCSLMACTSLSLCANLTAARHAFSDSAISCPSCRAAQGVAGSACSSRRRRRKRSTLSCVPRG